MKEAFVIILVILALLVLTAVRYRKQISSMIGVARMLKDVKDQVGQNKAVRGQQGGVQLVQCSRCGVWVPENRTMKRNGAFVCSTDCSPSKVT